MATPQELMARDDARKRLAEQDDMGREPDGYIWVAGALMGFWNAPAKVLKFEPVKRKRAA